MHTVYLALGANVGDKQANIQKALVYLQRKFTELVCAPVCETKPWGYVEQENFLNTVVCGKTDLSLQELLHYVKSVEKRTGRIKRFTNGPREIDIDILFYDTLVYQDENLQIPHPRITERDFVLKPLVDLNLHLIHPVLHRTMRLLLEELEGERYIIRLASE